jgi:hypothetical protein
MTAGSLRAYKDSEIRHAWVLNLSTSGIGLLLETAIEPGTQLVIGIKNTKPGTFFDLLARVTHCTPQNSGEWLVGCELEKKLSQDDLEALL